MDDDSFGHQGLAGRIAEVCEIVGNAADTGDVCGEGSQFGSDCQGGGGGIEGVNEVFPYLFGG